MTILAALTGTLDALTSVFSFSRVVLRKLPKGATVSIAVALVASMVIINYSAWAQAQQVVLYVHNMFDAYFNGRVDNVCMGRFSVGKSVG